MLLFRNIRTNVLWNIVDIEHQNRLSQDDDYELVEIENDDSVIDVKDNFDNQILPSSQENTEYKEEELKEMKWDELVKLAKSMGINSHGVKKIDLIQAILKLQENKDVK